MSLPRSEGRSKAPSGSVLLGPSVLLATPNDNLPAAAQPPAESEPGVATPGARSRKPDRGWVWYVVAVVVVAVVMVVAAYAILGEKAKPSTGSQGNVIEAAGTLFMIPVDEYNAIIITPTAVAAVSGTITNLGGAVVYLMTSTQYRTLFNTYNATEAGYEWTTGAIPSGIFYDLKLSVPVGNWDIVFANSVVGNSTAIGFYTALVETE